MSSALCLIALSLGYLVYLQAVREKEGLRILGQVIAIVVMIASIGGFICSTVHRMKGGSCPKGQCPVLEKKIEAKNA